jgi:hypothetical protein
MKSSDKDDSGGENTHDRQHRRLALPIFILQRDNRVIDVAALLVDDLAVPGDVGDFLGPVDVASGFDVNSAKQ